MGGAVKGGRSRSVVGSGVSSVYQALGREPSLQWVSAGLASEHSALVWFVPCLLQRAGRWASALKRGGSSSWPMFVCQRDATRCRWLHRVEGAGCEGCMRSGAPRRRQRKRLRFLRSRRCQSILTGLGVDPESFRQCLRPSCWLGAAGERAGADLTDCSRSV